jgi:hypothetical protein
MLVITATSTESEKNPEAFYNTLVELGLLAATVVALAVAICILRFSHRKYVTSTTPCLADSGKE